MTLHVISVHEPSLGTMPVIRKRYIDDGRYKAYMHTILRYMIHNKLHQTLPDELYVAIGGGGVVTMCAGAPLLHFLRRMKKRIVLGSGISGGAWAFAFASYVDVDAFIEDLPLPVASEIVHKLQERLNVMYDGIEGTIDA